MRIQIGGQIGYMTATTTETSTVQTVNFLDTGVILLVTPHITDDHQVLLTVKPQVATGRINPTTELPESETTEVETKVMLADGEAIVIGGLIKEVDNDIQNKVPWLGDLKYIGWFFQRRNVLRERTEVIITLMPRILSETPGCRQVDSSEVVQARTRLFCGPLCPVDRSQWEPRLRDAYKPPCAAPQSPIEYLPPTQNGPRLHPAGEVVPTPSPNARRAGPETTAGLKANAKTTAKSSTKQPNSPKPPEQTAREPFLKRLFR